MQLGLPQEALLEKAGFLKVKTKVVLPVGPLPHVCARSSCVGESTALVLPEGRMLPYLFLLFPISLPYAAQV